MDNLNFQYNYKIPELSKDIKIKYKKKPLTQSEEDIL